MKILVLNCGSSSIKYALYNMDDKSVMTSGGAERVGLVMGTRSGDIDGGAVTFIEKKCGLDADGMSNLLNKKSGVARPGDISAKWRSTLSIHASPTP